MHILRRSAHELSEMLCVQAPIFERKSLRFRGTPHFVATKFVFFHVLALAHFENTIATDCYRDSLSDEELFCSKVKRAVLDLVPRNIL